MNMLKAENKKDRFYRIILCLIIVQLTTLRAEMEADSYWCIKAGEYIVTNRCFLTGADTFSWIGAELGTEWLAHSWLSNVLSYLLWLACGKNTQLVSGIWNFISYFPLLLLVSGAYKYNPGKGSPVSPLAWLIVLLLPIRLLPSSLRAQNIGLLLYAVMLRLFMAAAEDENSKALWFYPVLVVLWANLYGGLIWLPFIYALTYFVCSFINISSGKTESRPHGKSYRIKTGYAALSTLLFGCLNPYGVRLFLYPITENKGYTKSGVIEWSAGSFDTMPLFIIFVVAVVAILLLSDKKYTLEELVPICSSAAMTFIYCHFRGFFAIAFMLFLTLSDGLWFTKWRAKPFDRVLVPLIAALVLVAPKLIPAQSLGGIFERMVLSDELISAVKNSGCKRLYNDYNSGGYLIFNDIPVFCDSRADLYPEDVLLYGKYLLSIPFAAEECDGEPFSIETALSRYEFDAFIAEKASSTDCYLSEHGFTPSAEDDYYVFYILKPVQK